MDTALGLHRFQFAFTVTYHYLFPQLTMGLALLIFVLKTGAIRTGNEVYDRAAAFWIRIFGIAFAMGVVTGIPLEFQFGTNWARFSKAAGGVIGHTLAMEGLYAFFLESALLGILLFGENRISRKAHWVVSGLLFVGTWLSAYFILATVAWMQHPVGYEVAVDGDIQLASFSALLFNPWLGWMYLHNQLGSLLTGSLVMAGVGAAYLLLDRHHDVARLSLRAGVVAGFIAAVALLFPTGDMQGQNVARHQPVTLAAMEGHFETTTGAPIAILGQPDPEKMRLDNPLLVPNVLSFITWRRWDAEVKGLDAFPRDQWPTNIPLLYYSFHIMVGLGTLFILLTALALFRLWRGALFSDRPLLWALALSIPFPFIANTAGWMTAEMGRQPWLIYGLMRTEDGTSPYVSAGNTLFTLIGFMGMYGLLTILFLLLTYRVLDHGPRAASSAEDPVHQPAPAATY